MKPALLLLFALLALRMNLCAGSVWEPAKTWIFAVGVLNFENKSLGTWPDEGRQDAVMLEAYRKRGVPTEQMVFLKNKDATASFVKKQFATFLDRTGEDATLVFYYAGHGGRDYSKKERTVNLVTYDNRGLWTLKQVFDTIEEHFNGSQVLLTADCCHSGALAVEASLRGGDISYGVLTSSTASARSTGNWTFTRCLTDLISGSALVDLDRNGIITFAEAVQYCDAEMAFAENQRAGHVLTGRFSPETVLSKAAANINGRIGERCEGYWQKKWYKAKIIAARDGQFQVTWPGWKSSYDEWLGADQLRPYHPVLLPSGSKVDIEWSGKWYPGKVVRSEMGLLLVHYDGYPEDDDEWVPPGRVKAK